MKFSNKAFNIWSILISLLIINISILAANSLLITMLSYLKKLKNNTNNLYTSINLEACYAVYQNQEICQTYWH